MTTTEIAARKAGLLQELDAAKHRALTNAKKAHFFSQLLILGALASSFAAVIIGWLFEHASPRLVGGLAAVPPLIAFVASNLKLDARASWHYRKCNAVDALRSQLLYQLPEEPSVDQIAVISAARDKLNEVMQSEWDGTITTNWNEILSKASADAQAQAKSGN